MDVYVFIGDEYLFVSTVPDTFDKGEIVAALEVLFPTMVGVAIEPTKEEPDAP